jgi:peptidoglycan/xylan/chitin deacetylase (PgdA/CDA1 family)
MAGSSSPGTIAALRSRARRAARHVALDLLEASSRFFGWAGPALAAPRVQILYLHHVFPTEIQGFRSLLDRLAVVHTFIPYSEAVARIESGDIDRPYVAFSADDGIKSCLTMASILEEFGASACFFVVGSMVGASDANVTARFSRNELGLPAQEFLNWEDLEVLIRRGHEVGSHSMSHSRLVDLSPNQLDWEVGESRRTLVDHLGVVDHFAWPFGRFSDAPSDIASIVHREGYRSCASAQRGAHMAEMSGQEKVVLYRDHVIASWPTAHVMYFMAKNARARQGAGVGIRRLKSIR